MCIHYYEENDERMSESIITDIYIGKYVLVQLVDENVELTAEQCMSFVKAMC